MFNLIKSIFSKKEIPEKIEISVFDEFILLCPADLTLINMEALKLWIEYKWQIHGIKYKTKRPVNDMIKSGDFDAQMLLVKNSIKKGYSGLFPPKTKKKQYPATRSQDSLISKLSKDKNQATKPYMTKKQASDEIQRLISLPDNIVNYECDNFKNLFIQKKQPVFEITTDQRIKLFMRGGANAVKRALKANEKKLKKAASHTYAQVTRKAAIAARKKLYTIVSISEILNVQVRDVHQLMLDDQLHNELSSFVNWLPNNPYFKAN